MKALPRILALGLFAAAAVPAFAINKCTSSSGNVTYQEAPCEASAKSEQPKNIQSPGTQSDDRWSFFRQKDDMTGQVTCFALSPTAYLFWGRGGTNSTRIRIQIATSPEGGLSLTVRTLTNSKSFHPRFTGSGIKIDKNDFLPFTRAIDSNGLGFEQSTQTAIIGQLSKGQSFRARVRMWPYDDLLDTEAISTAGFNGAMQQALSCATPK